MITINIFAVLISALSAFVLGFLFHAPLLGKLWMKLADIHPTGNEKFSEMIPQLIWNFLTNFVTAAALAVIYSLVLVANPVLFTGAIGGALCAWIVWIGFLVTSSSIDVIWMGRKASLWLFEVACSFVVMGAMGAIIAVW